MKNIPSKDLAAMFIKVLTAEYFTPADAVELKKLYEEILTRKDIKLGAFPIEKVGRMDFITGKAAGAFVQAVPTKSTEINLTVLDKETVSLGLKKYALGYAIDSTKPFEGDNMVKACEVILNQDFRVDSVVCVKVTEVLPIDMNGKYQVSLTNPHAFEARKEKPYSAKEIIRKAYTDNCLILTQESALALNTKKILQVNIDKSFGVPMDKVIKFNRPNVFGNHNVVYGVVYPVDEIDTDGDSATPEEVLKACWKFMENYQQLNYMHKDEIKDVSIVECATALADAPTLGIKKGDWYMAIRVTNPELRKQIESGEITGFSMEGTALPGGN